MNLDRVKKILQSLAEGIDPYTGVALPTDSVYHNPSTVRALYTALRALDESRELQKEALKESKPSPVLPSPKPTAETSNASRLWDKGEDRQLKDGFRAGLTAEELAAKHGRSVGSITARLVYLGLVSAPGHKFS
ncbi:MAG: hypothetical protein AMXMBFR84_42180 [Candidatus Hydrogenedentota bacterium]